MIVFLLLLALGCSKKESGFEIHDRVPSSGEAFSAALEQTVGAPLRPGHRVQLHENGKVFDSLLEAIGHARETVHAEMYIWTKGKASDRVLDAIAGRKAKGVACRILVDALGTASLDDELRRRFSASGCELRVFRPLDGPGKAARDHRKIFVIDGRTGFTGGFGVDDRWLGGGRADDEWRDIGAANRIRSSFGDDCDITAHQMADVVAVQRVGEDHRVHADLEAAALAGLGEELLRLCRVVGRDLPVLAVAGVKRRVEVRERRLRGQAGDDGSGRLRAETAQRGGAGRARRGHHGRDRLADGGLPCARSLNAGRAPPPPTG